jgi:hypothetical protein
MWHAVCSLHRWESNARVERLRVSGAMCRPAGESTLTPSGARAEMRVDGTIFRKRLSFTRAPDWVQCELCQRAGEHLPARFVVAVDDESDRPPPVESKTLRLLCIDCSALVEGAIDATEWKRRTNFVTAK